MFWLPNRSTVRKAWAISLEVYPEEILAIAGNAVPGRVGRHGWIGPMLRAIPLSSLSSTSHSTHVTILLHQNTSPASKPTRQPIGTTYLQPFLQCQAQHWVACTSTSGPSSSGAIDGLPSYLQHPVLALELSLALWVFKIRPEDHYFLGAQDTALTDKKAFVLTTSVRI